jgi:hypothetical protein
MRSPLLKSVYVLKAHHYFANPVTLAQQEFDDGPLLLFHIHCYPLFATVEPMSRDSTLYDLLVPESEFTESCVIMDS